MFTEMTVFMMIMYHILLDITRESGFSFGVVSIFFIDTIYKLTS